MRKVDGVAHMTYYGHVKTVKISEFKAHISEELRRVRNGERIVILDRDRPVAEVIPFETTPIRVVVRPPKGPRTLPAITVKTNVDPLAFLLEDRAKR